jgi:Raf kinase inhibitor-like YbhB/YbcL family protein
MEPTNFQLTSPAFEDDQVIPEKYTCKGEDISPPLAISGTPDAAQSLALIMHDPDAPNGDFLHWTIWNIDPETVTIAENTVPNGALQGKTGFGHAHYGGPCPPSGTHRYIFNLYALSEKLDLAVGSSREDLEEAMEGLIIAQAKLTGNFSAS